MYKSNDPYSKLTKIFSDQLKKHAPLKYYKRKLGSTHQKLLMEKSRI